MTTVYAVVEYNEKGCLVFAENFPGAFKRGSTQKEALGKFGGEITQYLLWRGMPVPAGEPDIRVVQQAASALNIHDADSEIIFESEKPPLKMEEYLSLKALALKSAADFQTLFDSVPDKNISDLKSRKTFYGDMPTTADEMYEHTKNVNGYYWREIGVPANSGGNIFSCRKEAFGILERQEEFLANRVVEGSCNEYWSLKKVCRRFVWHDRIHAKAMYKMASRVFGTENIKNPFLFIISK